MNSWALQVFLEARHLLPCVLLHPAKVCSHVNVWPHVFATILADGHLCRQTIDVVNFSKHHVLLGVAVPLNFVAAFALEINKRTFDLHVAFRVKLCPIFTIFITSNVHFVDT